MNFAKYISVIVATMIKFVGGPLTGVFLQLNWIETAICSLIGMMLTVILVMFFGEFLGKVFQFFFAQKSRKKFTKTNRLVVKTRQQFGLIGIAFLTPLLLTPAGGTILALAFRYSKLRILGAMLLWGTIWAIVQSLFFHYARHLFS